MSVWATTTVERHLTFTFDHTLTCGENFHQNNTKLDIPTSQHPFFHTLTVFDP